MTATHEQNSTMPTVPILYFSLEVPGTPTQSLSGTRCTTGLTAGVESVSELRISPDKGSRSRLLVLIQESFRDDAI